MTDTPDHVVIPYSRFVEVLEQRRKRLPPPEPLPPTTDADVPPVPDHPTAPGAPAWSTR